MGWASSKRVEAKVVSDVIYRPAPSSFALFDISTIEEPWLKSNIDDDDKENEKIIRPDPILEKLNTFEFANDGNHSWSEVSKALEELKPSLHNSQKPALLSEQVKSEVQQWDILINKPTHFTKSNSIHTLEELDKKLSVKPTDQLKKSESMNAINQHELKKVVLKKADSKKTDSQVGDGAPIIYEGVRPVKENMFILKDRMERGKDGMVIKRRDPLSEYPEKCTPDGAESVVLYTTSLRGVRRTFEDCNRIRSAIELQGVVIDERDVSLT